MKFSIASSDGSTDIFADSAGRRLAGPVREDEGDEIIEKCLRPYQAASYSKALRFKCGMPRALSCYCLHLLLSIRGLVDISNLCQEMRLLRSGAGEDFICRQNILSS